MANLKEIKNRIDSVSSTKQITSAMKMVSASKLRRAQQAVARMRPYIGHLQEIVGNLNSYDSLLLDNSQVEGASKDTLLIVLASNKGLCGGFNSGVVKEAMHYIENFYKNAHADEQVKLITIGRKVSEFFVKTEHKPVAIYDEVFDHLHYDKYFEDLTLKIINDFTNGVYQKVEIIYNHSKNAATQEIRTEHFLPLGVDSKKNTQTSNDQYICMPNWDYIAEVVIPQALKAQLYGALLDSYASEHGARMTSMQKATDNAETLTKSLTLTYNKARQTAITNEILEIVNGAEALRSR